jgi:hypothetical protein
MLTYVGLVLAAVQVGVSAAVSRHTRASLSRLSTSGTPTLVSTSNAVVVGIALARGANPARIVLASLMGLFALAGSGSRPRCT